MAKIFGRVGILGRVEHVNALPPPTASPVATLTDMPPTGREPTTASTAPLYVDLRGFATAAGLTHRYIGELAKHGKLPDPDVIVGERVRGWRPRTVAAWIAARQGQPAPPRETKALPVILDSGGVAERLGITEVTWRAYKTRGGTPPPDLRLGHVDCWQPATIDAWHAARRGAGWRKGRRGAWPGQ